MKRRLERLIRIEGAAATCVLMGATSLHAQQAQTTTADDWQFTATPYLWTAGQNGSARIGTRLPAQNVDASFSDILSNLDWGAMAAFEARKDRWGILADLFYVQLSKTSDPLLQGALGTAGLKADNTLVEVAGAYRAWQNDAVWLDVIGGVRYFNLHASISLSSSPLLPAGRYQSDTRDWTDGFVGVRSKQRIADHWALVEYLDIGAGGSSYSYQAIAGVEWSISQTFGLQLGYRLLAEDYDTTGFLYNMRTAGPYLGLSIKW